MRLFRDSFTHHLRELRVELSGRGEVFVERNDGAVGGDEDEGRDGDDAVEVGSVLPFRACAAGAVELRPGIAVTAEGGEPGVAVFVERDADKAQAFVFISFAEFTQMRKAADAGAAP